MKELIASLLAWYSAALQSGGYWLVTALMVMESTIFPVPSEVIIPPAAHLAHTTGRMTVWGVVLAGALGSWLGATLMYWASRWAGRPLVLRYGRYMRMSEAKIQLAENWARRYGPAGVFVSRLVPGVRQIVGIPMGIVKMDFRWYSLYTFAGAAIWCSVLAWLGVVAGDDPQVLKGDVHRITLWLGGILAVLGTLYYFLVHRSTREKS